MDKGFFLTLEGGEGAGKSTQTRLLKEKLTAKGHEVVTTREPGGSDGAEALRELLLFGGHEFSQRAEIMAMFAARCDHIDQTIRPALERGAIVICDRFADSTEAYQGFGRGQGAPETLALISTLRGTLGVVPDLTIILTLDDEIARHRVAGRGGRSDRFDAQGQHFHERVKQGFSAIATREPERCVTLDASGTPEEIAEQIELLVSDRMAGKTFCLAERA